MSLNGYTTFVLQLATFVARNAQSLAGRRRRATIAAALGSVLLSAALSACGGTREGGGEVGVVEGFAGMVVADEPRAAVLGRDILGNGGNAFDAAIAMYFTLAVTLPSRASLGAGGTCVVYDSSDNEAEVLLFLPKLGRDGGMVPLGPRAMAALHARYGSLRWSQLLIPAENLARFGHPISRAFDRDLIVGSSRIVSDPVISRTFRNNAGEMPNEGDKVIQPDLAAVLAGLRVQGAGYLYSGVFTPRLAAAMTAAGQPVTVEEIRSAIPVFVEPPSVGFGDDTLYFTSPPAADGLVAAQLWKILAEKMSLAEAGTAQRAHQFLEAAARAFAQRAEWMAPDGAARETPEDLLRRPRDAGGPARRQSARARPRGVPKRAAYAGGQPIAASGGAGREPPWRQLRCRRPLEQCGSLQSDHERAVRGVPACSLTMNGLFGAFQMAPDTGILLAAPPEDDSNGFLSPSAAILVNHNSQEAYFAAASSGGSAAPTALVSVMLEALVDDLSLQQTLSDPRFHHSGAPDVAFYEKGVPDAVLEDLRGRGHLLREAPHLARVNALHCPNSFERDHEDCRFANDPRGWGLGVLVQ
jgi:gamma-glutamyltranspeptidase/glutathione hydrolase